MKKLLSTTIAMLTLATSAWAADNVKATLIAENINA